MQNLGINGARLWASLMAMAAIGATPKGGNRRLALSDEDRQGRDLFVRWCREADLQVSVDRMGNIFGRRAGRADTLPPILAGSHLDTQPTGGRFDGPLGVLAALELVRTLNDRGIETEAPIEIVNWANEEGARFAPPMLASAVFAGAMTLADGLARTDRDGKRYGEELNRIGYAGPTAMGGRPVGAFFELHIEQGPLLEQEKKTIGIVTMMQAVRYYDITVTGEDGHAGATPMAIRQDALLAAAKLAVEANRLALSHAPNGRATVGYLQPEPNVRGVVPGRCLFSLDFRHPDQTRVAAMDATFRTAIERIAGEDKVTVEITHSWTFGPTPFDESCIGAVREAAERRGYSRMELYSGAGHDACNMARVAPTSMIFIPCERGLSHNEAENITQADAEAGANVLLDAVLAKAGLAKAGLAKAGLA